VSAPRTVEVSCTVDIEHSAASLHAHVTLDGVDVRPGDQVILRSAPCAIAFGETRRYRTTATVVRASWWQRRLMAARSLLELTTLYEVSFSERNTL
jgi:hypothetical protein